MTDTTRKLATIVALDVAGYSARTEADEARTTAEVAALRKVIEAIAAKHGGRVFNTAGDGFMLEFSSSLSAVEAAIELAETCEPKVRVGVHLGAVHYGLSGQVWLRRQHRDQRCDQRLSFDWLHGQRVHGQQSDEMRSDKGGAMCA